MADSAQGGHRTGWDDRLSIGHPEIDREHMALFAIGSRLSDAGPSAGSEYVMSDVLCELADYARDHFGREETLMRIAKFSRCIEHVLEHWKFIQKLTRLIDAYERGRPDVLPELREFLGEWLTSHISIDDREFGDFLRSSGQGQQPPP